MSSVDIDVTEILKLANDLENVAPRQMLKAARKVTVAEIKKVQDKAKAEAPRDRPWLATQGIKRRTSSYSDAIVGTVFTVPDPRGRAVGFFVLYGTSSTPPQDFLTPAFIESERVYPDAVLAAIDPLAIAAGGGDSGGGSEGDA